MKKQIVCLVEGPDGVGKTTISQNAARIMDVPYFKNLDEHRYFLSDPSYFKHAIQYVDSYFFKYLKESGASIILDRAWPSEWVYSQVLDRETDMETLSWLDRFSASMGTKIVMPYRTTYDHVEDYDIIKEKILDIDRAYIEFTKWTKCDVLRLCVDDQDLDGDTLKVINFLRS